MHKISLIAVHCTATLAGRPFNLSAIRDMHIARGFKDIGYHWLIGLEGEVWSGRPETRPGAHIAGHNVGSVGICYVGGIGADGKPADTRTPAQLEAMEALLRRKRQQYPQARIRGHRDLSPDRDGDGVVEPHEWLKACPCFDVALWCRDVGIDPR